MENITPQFDFEKYSAWTGQGGLFGSYNEDHSGLLAFVQYLNEIKRSNGDHLPYDNWQIINPEGFLAFLEREKEKGKNYENLIHKTKELIRQGEMNYENTLYFAKALNDLNFLYQKDEDVIAGYSNLLRNQPQSTPTIEKNTDLNNQKIENQSEEIQIADENPQIKSEKAVQSENVSPDIADEMNIENENSMLKPLVEIPKFEQSKKEEPHEIANSQEAPAKKEAQIPLETAQMPEPKSETQVENDQTSLSTNLNLPKSNSSTEISIPEKKVVMPVHREYLPENRRLISTFENLRIKQPKKPKKIAIGTQNQPQTSQSYQQTSQTEQIEQKQEAVTSGGANLAKKMALFTGGGLAGLFGLTNPADAAEIVFSFFK